MKGNRILRYILNVLASALIFFAARLVVSFLAEENTDYISISLWAVFMGLTCSLFDKPMKNAVRAIMVAMHGEEKVKQNEERAAKKR